MGQPGRTAVAAAAIILASAISLSAQVPLGSEFRVDTQGVATPFFLAGQHRASAMDSNGNFVVGWAIGTGYDFDVALRRFDAAGVARGPEFRVNTYTTGWQYNHSLAVDDAGNVVVVWASTDQDGSSEGIFGQRFDASGAALGSEFRVNSTTLFSQMQPSVAVAPDGAFVVVWASYDADSSFDIFGQRYDDSGAPAGAEFQVNTYTTAQQYGATVDVDGAGNFVVAWTTVDLANNNVGTYGQLFSAAGARQGGEFAVNSSTAGNQTRSRVARSRDGAFVVVWQAGSAGILARRFDATGVPLGADFVVNEHTTGGQARPEVDADADGDFVVTWNSPVRDGSGYGVFARRFDSTGVGGAEFRANTYTTGHQQYATIASDPAGNFIVAWHSTQNGVHGAFAQRYAGGLSAAALAVDGSAGPASDGNGVFEPGETVAVAPSWLNANFSAETFTGTASSFSGPGSSTYTTLDGAASYGTVASNATGSCNTAADCYALGITVPTTRPAQHWDASFHEQIAPANLGAAKTWALHVGDSFIDVPRASGFYRFVETLLHRGITTGCTATEYCPLSGTTREQMAVFVLVAKEGAGYVPPACTTPMFNDVPASNPFCRWIEELARRNVVAGCGGGNYCPASPVTREQMAVFVLLTKEPGLQPPACGTPMFNDVPASSGFCRWIEELARRAVVTGCGGGNYCPAAPVTREQMAVFVSTTFGHLLYGP